MSRNGSGTYTLPAGNPVVSGTTITTTWGNTTLTDIANALTASVAADGQTPMTGALNMANNKVTALATPTISTDAATKAYVDLTQTASGITGGTITGATLTNDTIDSSPIGSTVPSTVKATGLTVTGATSGTLALAATAVAGTNTATFPAATGTVMVSGNMPAFSAYQSSAQTISNGVATKVLFQTEEFDTNNNFASSTFTPTVAGYYQINGACQPSTITTFGICAIYKNGSLYKANITYAASCSTSVASLIYCNGTTDYIEIYATCGGTTPTLVVGTVYTFFNGSLTRAS